MCGYVCPLLIVFWVAWQVARLTSYQILTQHSNYILYGMMLLKKNIPVPFAMGEVASKGI